MLSSTTVGSISFSMNKRVTVRPWDIAHHYRLMTADRRRRRLAALPPPRDAG
jgi:hypothetical protein